MGYEKYTYEGPVLEFDRVVSERWYGSTYAKTEQRARCNLTYQYKKQFGKTAASKITLPAKIQLVK